MNVTIADGVFGVPFPDRHDAHEGAQMERRATFVLGDRLTLSVEETRAVAALLDVGREGRLHQGLAHLLHHTG
jgi:hypothetical protein